MAFGSRGSRRNQAQANTPVFLTDPRNTNDRMPVQNFPGTRANARSIPGEKLQAQDVKNPELGTDAVDGRVLKGNSVTDGHIVSVNPATVNSGYGYAKLANVPANFNPTKHGNAEHLNNYALDSHDHAKYALDSHGHPGKADVPHGNNQHTATYLSGSHGNGNHSPSMALASHDHSQSIKLMSVERRTAAVELRNRLRGLKETDEAPVDVIDGILLLMALAFDDADEQLEDTLTRDVTEQFERHIQVAAFGKNENDPLGRDRLTITRSHPDLDEIVGMDPSDSSN